MYERDAADLLDIPATVTQTALLAIACFTGTEVEPAKRVPAPERTYWNAWGATRR